MLPTKQKLRAAQFLTAQFLTAQFLIMCFVAMGQTHAKPLNDTFAIQTIMERIHEIVLHKYDTRSELASRLNAEFREPFEQMFPNHPNLQLETFRHAHGLSDTIWTMKVNNAVMMEYISLLRANDEHEFLLAKWKHENEQYCQKLLEELEKRPV